MKNNSNLEVRNIILPDDLDAVKKLWFDYLVWGNDNMQHHYGVHPHNPKETVEQDIQRIDKFLPPHGRIMVAFHESKICGVGCLKSITKEIGEIKRMYVHPDFRSMGAGRGILNALLAEAKKAGYKSVRLDSPKFMEAAHSLYRSFGFQDIAPYPEMEIPPHFKDFLLFMEIKLE